VAEAQVVRVEPPFAMSGAATALSDVGVGADLAQIRNGSVVSQYLFTTGTLSTNTNDSVFGLARHSFTPSGLGAPTIALWPAEDHLTAQAQRTLKASAVVNDTALSPGSATVYMAGIVPSVTAGHWDLMTLKYNQDLSLQWTDRMKSEDHPELPVVLAATGAFLAEGSTRTVNGHQSYHVRVFNTGDGSTSSEGYFENPGYNAYGPAVLTSLAIASVDRVVLVASGTAPGMDGHTKMVTVQFDETPPGSHILLPTRLDPPGDNDGRDYVCNRMFYYSSDGTPGNASIAVTGSVNQGSIDYPTWRNYFTALYAPESGHPADWGVKWSDEYDGPANADDASYAVRTYAAVEQDGPHLLTWVTGESTRTRTPQVADPLTICYDWLGGSAPVGRRWVARRQEPSPNSNGGGAGLALTLATPNDTLPMIYVQAKTRLQDGNGVFRWNYEYLSYDDVPAQNPTQEDKPTRGEDPSGALPAACYYSPGGLSGGDSVPSGFAVHKYWDYPTGQFLWYMTRNGSSFQSSSTGFDVLTTLERDTQR
jgi:hypothetical protein